MRHSRAAAVALALLAPLGTACDEKHSSAGPGAVATATPTTPPSAAASASARPRLPAAIAASKRIRVGADINYPPLEFYGEGTKEARGFDVDLCNVVARKLAPDTTCEFVNSDFDRLLDDLGAGKFDIVMSAMTDRAQRQPKADFIDYFRAGMSIIIPKGNPQHLTTFEDLCGKSLGAQKGSDEEVFANQLWTTCSNAGKPALAIVAVKTDAESLARVKARTLAADLEDFPAASYAAKTSGGGNDFELLGPPNGQATYGIAVAKTNTELRDALFAALKQAFADGSYDAVVVKWKLFEGELKAVEINGG